ncbi:hypothetical protein K2Z83_15155 [Oscillochloris sp. ZM17-4]|uniref:hypothetical protein n=1 Tax=Oscillochloris sp. ZM17-4 TaxID=2866714 RepID=UPI001C72D462|nr:hypothetical protein [Oscillochloris sp. ZM17-4]MBX0329015.1 hypothetical protein [Oscillochloris sp. ZM17-4]
MSLSYRAAPNPNNTDQIRLFVRCASDMQAESLWRALRERFPWVSRRMSSFDPAFSAFFFVQASEVELQSAWPQIVAAVAPATAMPTTAPQPAPRAASQLSDLAAWDRGFRAAVRQVHAEIPRQSTATQEVSLGWVVEQVRAGNADEVESLLGQPTISPSSALRAQIALFSETGQHERVVALVESRRREVLALPASGLLAEQIVGAYLEFGRANAVEDALRGAQQIAGAMLPELERLRQADHVRDLLRRALTPGQPPDEPVAPTLREQIAGIIRVAPADQIAALEVLREDHAGTVELHLALGAAYAAAGQPDAALEAYAGASPHDDTERAELLGRRAELLLESRGYREVISLLPADDDMPADLAALRGAALYWLGRTAEGRTLLERAWAEGERRRALLLPLARGRAVAGQDDGALQVYRLLLDNAPDLLEPQDLARLATGLYLDRPGDISTAQIADLCERYVKQGGPTTRSETEVDDILSLRVRLWASVGDDRWLTAQADRLEWLAVKMRAEALRTELDALREQSQRGHLQRQAHFEILEGLEVIALDEPATRAALAGEYQALSIAEVDAALLRNEPIPAFVQAMRRSLHFLDRPSADFIAEYIDDERARLRSGGHEATAQVFTPAQDIDLSAVRLTIVGGHVATRREVRSDLCERYGLIHYEEIPPSSEAHIDHDLVRDRTTDRDLVVVITGYTGHDLTGHVRDLQRSGELPGRVIWPRCRGKSGVVREILEASVQTV